LDRRLGGPDIKFTNSCTERNSDEER